MAVTEQQFIEQYSQLSADKQQKMYNAWNAQVKSWIDAYNASQNTSNNYSNNYSNNNNYSSNNNYSNNYSNNYNNNNYSSSNNYNTQNYTDWANVGSWNYWIDTPDRQEEIVSHLNEYYQQDPSKFSDWNTFANYFNYNYSWRSDMERETMRNWYQQKVGNQMDANNANNTDYFLSQLMSWQTLQWTWAAISAAQNRYRDYQSLSGMTPEQIASAVSSNAINPVGQSMQDLKNYSPQLYAQVQSILQNQTRIDDINAAWKWIYEWLTKSEYNSNYTKYNFTDEYAKNASVIKQYNESLYKKIEWLWWDTAAYVAIVASMLQNPLIQANKDEIENIEWEIRKIQDNIYTISDTAREKLWSEAPEDLVSAYISHQTKQLQTQLRTAQNSLLVAQWKLDNQLSEVETLIDALNNWIELEWWTWWTWWTGWSSDYQFVSATKYQPAWYFNKKTWEFIPLSWSTSWGSWTWGTWTGWTGWTWWWNYGWGSTPTYDYQDDSAARLKQISDNIDSIYKTNPDVFKNRTVFNDFFHFYERSQAQKDVLNSAWMKYGKMFWPDSIDTWAWESQTTQTTSDNSLVNAIKKDLINRTVNFSSTSMKKTYWKYWTQAQSWDEDTTNDYLQEIWKISTVSELKSMLWHLSKDANKKALLTSLGTKVRKELAAITWEWKNDTEKAADKKKKQNEKLRSYADKLWVDATTLATRWNLLKK